MTITKRMGFFLIQFPFSLSVFSGRFSRMGDCLSRLWCPHFLPPCWKPALSTLLFTSLDPSMSVRVSEGVQGRKPSNSWTKGLKEEQGHRSSSPAIPSCSPKVCQLLSFRQQRALQAHQIISRSPILVTVGPSCLLFVPYAFLANENLLFIFWWHDLFSVINKVKLLDFITESPSDFQLWCPDKWIVVYYFQNINISKNDYNTLFCISW